MKLNNPLWKLSLLNSKMKCSENTSTRKYSRYFSVFMKSQFKLIFINSEKHTLAEIEVEARKYQILCVNFKIFVQRCPSGTNYWKDFLT